MSQIPTDDAALAKAFDLSRLTPAFAEDPFPTYRALLKHATVKRFSDGSVMVSRHADLMRVYRDTETFSSDKKVEFAPKYGDTPLFLHHTTSLVFNDPPLHTRVRRIMSGALTPRAISAMEPALVRLVDTLLDGLGESCDLITEYASAIPVEVIGNLFDIPHEERGPLRDWSLAILGALEPVLSDVQTERGNAAVVEFSEYLKDLTDLRRKSPGDPETDVLTRLLQGDRGDHLTEDELIQNCIFILNAGHETTTNLIGNGLDLLLEHPDQRDMLLMHPDLIGSAIEEILRHQSSNQLGNRITTKGCEIGGMVLPEGTRVHLIMGAANRDPEQFPDPDRFDVTRHPNRHLAFAGGPHVCLGLTLARLEGRIAILRFIERFPDYQRDGAATRTGRVRFRGFSHLPAVLRKPVHK
ncbi:MAG: cytochrome P450 [Pseudomonadota bacterium]